MRTITILLLLCSLATGLLLADIQTPNRIPIEMKLSTFRALENRCWSPGVEFENAPQDIALTYYDYMPGSYNGSCFAIQPLQAQPYGSDADGLYLAYMYQENSTSQRRIYYTYINAAGEMNPHSAISPNSVREGFVIVDIDPVTANPFAIWHSDVDGDGLVEGMFSYDLYNLVGGPGLWHQPEPIINNPIPE
ncbi:MAG: hypothetical protein JXB60_04810, partial [Candidatus Cloacimonetes bacterium]|nr:hypothetical protein [Candidatus Cloacimonadota bacterium]